MISDELKQKYANFHMRSVPMRAPVPYTNAIKKSREYYMIDYTLERLIKEWTCLQTRYKESNGFITCERLQKLAREAQKLVGEDLCTLLFQKTLDKGKESFFTKSKELLKTLQNKDLPERSTFTERCFLLQWLLTELTADINESELYKTVK